jgi:hypothetical protein
MYAIDRAPGGPSGGGDDQVVSASRPAAGAGGDQELRVAPGHLEVVGQHRERRDEILEERPARRASPSRGELDTHTELGDRDRRDGRFVVVMDQVVQVQR